ncbi:MAG: YcaO-like family protein [Desulfatibacillaceae bacterium]
MMKTIHYRMELVNTEASTGYVVCRPEQDMDPEQALGLLRDRPNDTFLHRHVLETVLSLKREQAHRTLGDHPVDRAVAAEAAVLDPRGESPFPPPDPAALRDLARHTPMVDLRCEAMENVGVLREWAELFRRNLLELRPLPRPEDAGITVPYSRQFLEDLWNSAVPTWKLFQHVPVPEEAGEDVSPERTVEAARERLEAAGFLADHQEMRHEASLAHLGLLHRWKLDVATSVGTNRHTLAGEPTAYGRGYRPEYARASLYMEIVERVCAFASFDADGPVGYSTDHGFAHGSLEDLAGQGRKAVDPNLLRPDAPYGGEPLYWVRGASPLPAGGFEDVWVPAQCVFLFSNLDEIRLHAGLGSTGLASGTTVEQARLSALLEVVERDAEAATPYTPRRCFALEARDPNISAILEDYQARGIVVRFMDMTSWLGVPCFKSLVMGKDGVLAKGTDAKLSGPRAAMSALAETPYPYPDGPASAVPEKLASVPVRYLEDLLELSRGTLADLALLEATFIRNHRAPVYVDLTREDLGLPVVRAVVPQMEPMADFDRFSLPGPRMFAGYLAMWEI